MQANSVGFYQITKLLGLRGKTSPAPRFFLAPRLLIIPTVMGPGPSRELFELLQAFLHIPVLYP